MVKPDTAQRQRGPLTGNHAYDDTRGMKRFLAILSVASLTVCNSPRPAVVALATKLSNEGGDGLDPQYRAGYIACGVDALNGLPDARINAALKADNAPGRWAILGSDALDAYVAACRKVDYRRGPPPRRLFVEG